MEKTLKEISIMRVLATLMIVLCHMFSWFGITPLAMIFNVGVQCFLLISGYIYSNKEIGSAREFLKRRWIKLCVPMYIVYGVVCVIHIIKKFGFWLYQNTSDIFL